MTLFHLRVFAFCALVLILIPALTRWGDDRHPLAVEIAAPLCPKLVNPCSKIDCDRVDTRRLT